VKKIPGGRVAKTPEGRNRQDAKDAKKTEDSTTDYTDRIRFH
jgi:hypothetical protein